MSETVPSHRDPAPEGLRLVQELVNTVDIESGADQLDSLEGLRDHLVGQGMVDGEEVLTEADRSRMVEVREALRALLLANTGEPLHPRATTILNRAASGAPLVLRFGPDGEAQLVPEATGVERAVGRILTEVHRAMVEGTWVRLKVCINDECLWAFYDNSKNRSGKWCTMRVCGNRMKARAYRERQAAQG